MFWLGALVSLCYVPGLTGAYVATQWPVLAVVLCFGLLRSGPFTWLHGLGLAFIAYAAAGMAWTPTSDASVFGLWLIVIMGLSLWFGTTLTNVRSLYAGLALGGAVSSAMGVCQHFGLELVPSATPDAGLYVNNVQQGTVLALFAVALVSERMWLWALPLMPGIALCGSRGAWLALAIGLIGCYVRRVWVLAVLAIVGVAILREQLALSDQVRLAIWDAAWNNLKLFGWGPGVFYTILLPRMPGTGPAPWFYPEYAHNDGLQLVFEFGAAALLPACIFAFALSRTHAKEWPVILAFVAAGCYSMPLFMPLASFLALVAVGRILHDYGLARGDVRDRGYSVLPRRREAGRQTVSVASHHSAEG